MPEPELPKPQLPEPQLPKPAVPAPDEIPRCIRCGYNLTGLGTDAPCPECGTSHPFPRGPIQPPQPNPLFVSMVWWLLPIGLAAELTSFVLRMIANARGYRGARANLGVFLPASTLLSLIVGIALFVLGFTLLDTRRKTLGLFAVMAGISCGAILCLP